MAHLEFRHAFLRVNRPPEGLSDTNKDDSSILITCTLFTLDQLGVLESGEATKRQKRAAKKYINHMLGLDGLRLLSVSELKNSLVTLANELAVENPTNKTLKKFL